MELSSTTLSIEQSRLILRQDLRFHLRGAGDRAYYLVEDQVAGKFFQIGKLEYIFLSMLDGKRNVSQVMEKMATVRPDACLDLFHTAKICKWAIDSRIVERAFTLDEQEELAEIDFSRNTRTWLNPITLKIPFCRPDFFVEKLTTALGWCFRGPGLTICLTICLLALLQFLPVLDQFLGQRATVVSRQDLLWLAVAWIGLKLIHELGHAVACKSFGCSVRNCGLILLLLIPLPYVDVTEAWKLSSKWKRIVVSAAGMISEFFVAAIACFVWLWSDPGVAQTHAGNLIIAATLHTLLFNANPLMRFDGYYILSDLLDIPNLSTLGRAHAKSATSRIFFGTPSPKLEETGWRLRFIKIYGWLSIVWSLLVSAGIVVGAYCLFSGIGIVLAGIACLFWYGFPLISFCKYLAQGNDQGSPNRIRFAMMASLCVGLLTAFLTCCPGPSAVSSPLVVEYEPIHVVRSKTDGMVSRIHVVNGQSVEKGQLLMSLENQKLIADIESIKIDIEVSNSRINSLISRGLIAKVKLQEESLASMEHRQRELERAAAELEVCAIADGKILSRNLAELAGTYLRPGDTVMEIGAPVGLHAIAMLDQSNVSLLRGGNGECKIAIDGQPSFELLEGQIESISPRATQEIVHAAFDASLGGKLPVVARGNITNSSAASESEMIHSQPWFEVSIELEPEKRDSLKSGQTGTMYVYARRQSMGRYLLDRFWQVISPLRETSHGI